MRVGWLGLGAMGAPMAGCLARAGQAVVAYDIVPERAAALAADGVAGCGQHHRGRPGRRHRRDHGRHPGPDGCGPVRAGRRRRGPGRRDRCGDHGDGRP